MLLTISYSESAYPITPVQQLKTRFYKDFINCLLHSRKQQQKLLHGVDNIIFGINVTDYPIGHKHIGLFHICLLNTWD